jgi:hypothetical protein
MMKRLKNPANRCIPPRRPPKLQRAGAEAKQYSASLWFLRTTTLLCARAWPHSSMSVPN